MDFFNKNSNNEFDPIPFEGIPDMRLDKGDMIVFLADFALDGSVIPEGTELQVEGFETRENELFVLVDFENMLYALKFKAMKFRKVRINYPSRYDRSLFG